VHRTRFYPVVIALVAVLGAGAAFTTARMHHASAQTQQQPQPGQPRHGNRVFGTIQSVSGGTFVVIGRDGKTYTVRTTAGTKVVTQARARLSDIRTGDLVRVLATKGQDGSFTAVAVQDMPAGLALGPAAGGRGGAYGNTRNSGRMLVAGSVVSLNGSVLSVAARDGTATTVAVPASARISRTTTAPWASLAAGAHVSAIGTLNADGSLAASTIMVLPAER
jgi:Domain of unknown function (DUF5666)